MINRIQHFRRIVRIWNVLGHSIWTFVDVVRFALSKRRRPVEDHGTGSGGVKWA